MHSKFRTVTIRLDRDADGRLSTYSDDLPGLIMVGEKPEEIGPALDVCIKALIEYEGVKVLAIRRTGTSDVAKFAPGPVTYSVELAEAA